MDGRVNSSGEPRWPHSRARCRAPVDPDRGRQGDPCASVRKLLGFSAAASGTDFSSFRDGHIERVERNGHHAVETYERSPLHLTSTRGDSRH